MAQPKGKNRRVFLYGNPVLRQKAKPVRRITPGLRRLFADLRLTMLEQDGLGLAANQIGEPVAVFAVNPRAAKVDRDACCIINPVVQSSGRTVEEEEGCLSFPNLYDVVARPEKVRVAGLDEEGRPLEMEATGTLARALLHEVDHLNGILFIDYLSPTRRQMIGARLKEFEEQERKACR